MEKCETQTSARTKLLDAALRVIRTKGYQATTVDDLCAEAGVSKGSFFHYFASKEALAIAAAAHFSEMADRLFGSLPYADISDPRERVLGYLDSRAALLQGDLPDFTCLLGMMAQEVYATHPAIRDACNVAIEHHADAVARDLQEAKDRYAPDATWDAKGLALFTQAVLQGAFVLAKADNDPAVAADCMTHLQTYVKGVLS